MNDMNPGDIPAEYQEQTLTYNDGMQRKVLTTDIETAVPDGRLIVSRTDLNGALTHVNRSFVEMSAYQEEELIGESHYILRHPDMPAAAFKDLWETVKGGNKWHGYVKNLRKDGGFYWVYATVIANVRKGEVVGFTSVRRKPSRANVVEAEALYKTL